MLIIFVATVTHIEFKGAFVQLGDAFIFLAACFLPTSLAMLTAVVASAITCVLTGYLSLILYIVIIRALIACWFIDEGNKILNYRNIFGTIAAAFILIVGSYIADIVLLQDLTKPLTNLPFNTISSVINVVIFYVLAFILDKLKLRMKLMIKEEK